MQGLDSRLDQLAHRRRTLPELAEIARVTSEQNDVRDRVVASETEESDVQREVAKAETDVEAVRSRSVRDRERMQSGAVGSAKELEALQHEVESLARRQGVLEDVELEAMERLESVQAYLAEQRDRLTGLTSELSTLEGKRDEAFAAIDKDVDYISGERARAATGLPDDLMTLYAKLRADQGGIGAAALRQGRCQGCRLQLTPIEIGRIRDAPGDEVMRCEECRRILVRTAESGL
ncbi:MAG TPA: C4-type zinc ribbon domain-containing protein [Actinomycetes bacterium]